ncbi:lipopolysaccharide biosynthesis protein [Halorubrum ezzemoulense]|uniref:lipopolysaccharide biosynthesis protein n=1 Tax=Halorubrum ezzemoulense TaxID=337243 RepID=UPI00232F8A47|nr:lipopolysaccharide biosynthesis protein [Halorubrum ezzemoulense]MDB2262068.1 lipopolysaccharide biosynthesis protein [Halorubrum ezzemoulense]MDB2268915.1 lipopolysaccharide biosynthesis protein [Halorubrum ezzemoulense]
MLERLQKIYQRLTAGGSTEEQAVQSGVWVTGINVGDRVLQLVKVVILARLLSPEAFGLLGIALLVVAALRQLSVLGFDAALVQHQNENVDEYLNTVWIMKMVRWLVIAAIAVASAPFIAQFFDEPQVAPLIMMIAIANLLLAIQNPAIVYFRKDLNFHKEFMYTMSGRVANLGTAVAIAVVYRSVWALVLGIVAMNLVKVSLSYLIHDYRPSVEFNMEYAKEMFDFGKWLLISGIFAFGLTQGDDAFVGWFFAAAALGYYQLGYRYSNAPATEVTQVINRVAFPALSKVQDSTQKLRRGVFRVLRLSMVVSLPMALGIVAVAPQFVIVAFGEEWRSMIPLMQVLAVWGAFRAVTKIPASVFKAVGRPEYDAYTLILKVAFIALTIYPAAERFGVVGVAYVIVAQGILVEPIRLYLMLNLIEARASELIQPILYPAAGSLVMFSVTIGADRYIFTSTGILELCGLIALGAMVYGVVMILIERTTTFEFIGLYRRIRQGI